MKKYVLLTSCLALMGCEAMREARTPPPAEKEYKPGLFTGEKGYFELVPQAPKTQEEWDKAPGLLSDKPVVEKTKTSVKDANKPAPKPVNPLEVLAAS